MNFIIIKYVKIIYWEKNNLIIFNDTNKFKVYSSLLTYKNYINIYLLIIKYQIF